MFPGLCGYGELLAQMCCAPCGSTCGEERKPGNDELEIAMEQTARGCSGAEMALQVIQTEARQLLFLLQRLSQGRESEVAGVAPCG